MDSVDNLADLYLLTLVIEAGGFSAAARQAGITKSKLSRRIIELERRLGAPLLYRNARRFAVTATGEQVYRHAVLMRESALAAELAAYEGHGMSGGQVRISAHGLLLPLLDDLSTAFAQRHPHARLSVTFDGTHADDLLLHQQADIVLGLDEPPVGSDDVTAHVLGTARQATVVSPALFRHLGHPAAPEQVPAHLFLNYAAGAARWRARHEHGGHHAAARFASNHASALLAATRAGLGFARLPLYLCDADLRDGRLLGVFESDKTPAAPLRALTRREPAMPEAALGFLRFMRQHLTAMQLPGITVAGS
jgi:DNA-binding transcriptional LysR family regulator